MALIENEELSQQSELEAEEQKEEQAAQAAAPEVEIPEKYKGKSLEDIVKMHQEAERLIGRQAQEVGEVRRLADELLKQQLSQKKEVQPEVKPQEVDFFEDPQAAVKKAVETHPDVLAAKQAAMQMKQVQSQAMLLHKHPDFADVVRDPEFIEWVKGSPMRLNMYALADAQYDVSAADELLSTFKQIRTNKSKQVAESAATTRNQTLKAAAVDVGGTGESSKKVYRRADLIRLRMTDPDRYMAMQEDIMSAYAEGRVK